MYPYYYYSNLLNKYYYLNLKILESIISIHLSLIQFKISLLDTCIMKV